MGGGMDADRGRMGREVTDSQRDKDGPGEEVLRGWRMKYSVQNDISFPPQAPHSSLLVATISFSLY